MGQTEPNSQDAESDDVRVRAFASDRDRINAMRQGTERQPDVLRRVLDAYEDDAPDAEGRVLSEDAVDEIIEELAERVEPEQGYIDDDTIARAVAAKIDYAELATVVANEVEGRLR
jgi:hypothetical protein